MNSTAVHCFWREGSPQRHSLLQMAAKGLYRRPDSANAPVACCGKLSH